MQNPLDGIIPDFSIFGAEFTEVWQKIAAGLWGIAILIAVYQLGGGILAIAQNRDGHPVALRAAKREAQAAALALGGLVCLGVIVGAIIFLFS
ncbi:hypothetical protein NUM3379_14670 [Kineococcus sp. NUM-3379]